jgi:hypothetical protein
VKPVGFPLLHTPSTQRACRSCCRLAPLPACSAPDAALPAAALKRVLEAAEAQHGLTFRLGFELEFYLLKSPKDKQGSEREGGSGGGGVPPPIDGSNYCHSGALDAAAPGEQHEAGGLHGSKRGGLQLQAAVCLMSPHARAAGTTRAFC